MLSRSPTSEASSRPRCTAWSSPLSAATIRASSSTSSRARRLISPPPMVTTTCVIRFPPLALPRSGRAVGGGGHPLSPPILRAPGEPLTLAGRRRRRQTAAHHGHHDQAADDDHHP